MITFNRIQKLFIVRFAEVPLREFDHINTDIASKIYCLYMYEMGKAALNSETLIASIRELSAAVDFCNGLTLIELMNVAAAYVEDFITELEGN